MSASDDDIPLLITVSLHGIALSTSVCPHLTLSKVLTRHTNDKAKYFLVHSDFQSHEDGVLLLDSEPAIKQARTLEKCRDRHPSEWQSRDISNLTANALKTIIYSVFGLNASAYLL
jgi:hypothetical protein